MLKNVAQGKNADDLSGPSEKAIEGLERYVNPAHPSLPTMTSIIRIMRNIESMVSERQNGGHDFWEHHPDSTEELLAAWRRELREMLRTLDVRDYQLTMIPNF